MVAQLYDFFHRFHARTYGFTGSPIHDAVALAQVFRPDLVRTEHRHVAIECGSELTRGRTVVDLWRRMEHEPNAHVGVGVDGDAFVELLLERIPSLDPK
jgi:inosine-uridine nucleoside N-ribohydrolase